MRFIFLFAAVFFLKIATAQDSNRRSVPVNVISPKDVKILVPTGSLLYLEQVVNEPPKRSLWKKTNILGLDVSEVAFVNWNAGGSNSISALMSADIKRLYQRKNIRWNNELLARYGVNKQEGQNFRKTDDNIEINSTFGYRSDSVSNWYYSAKLNFSTQFSNGYKYPDTSQEISTLMAPGYLFLGIGSEVNLEEENFNAYLSPLTLRSTFVLDQYLANQGAFGVAPAVYDEDGNLLKEGENIRTEVGILLTNEYAIRLFENIRLTNKLSLYTDYLNHFGNIDVNWELQFNFKVNDYVVAKLGSHLKYDDDIKVQEENAEGELVDIGPKVQWKQQLGIGVIVEL